MQNSTVTNRFLIEIGRSNRVWYASNPLQVTRVSRACFLKKRLPLFFHEQRHSVNHIHAPPHLSHRGTYRTEVLLRYNGALWVPIFRTRVARYRPRNTCARKPGWFLFIDPHPEARRARGLYESNDSFTASARTASHCPSYVLLFIPLARTQYWIRFR